MARSTPHRSRARRGDGPRLRAEILAAAERLLIETGDESAVSIRAVAQAVGVTAPSIYLHFADRNELIFEVCEEQFRHLDETMEQAVAGVTDPWERVDRKGRAYVEFGLNNPEQYRILFTSRPDCTPERFMDERLVSTSAFGHLVEDLLAAMAGGQLAPSAGATSEEAALVACGLWMMVHGITSLLIAKPDFPWPDRQQLIDHVLQTYSAGLRSAGALPAGAPPLGAPAGAAGGVGASGGRADRSGAPAGGSGGAGGVSSVSAAASAGGVGPSGAPVAVSTDAPAGVAGGSGAPAGGLAGSEDGSGVFADGSGALVGGSEGTGGAGGVSGASAAAAGGSDTASGAAGGLAASGGVVGGSGGAAGASGPPAGGRRVSARRSGALAAAAGGSDTPVGVARDIAASGGSAGGGRIDEC